MATMLRSALRRCGLADTYQGHKYTAHATRRSFATWLKEAGVAEATIKRLMGHAGSGVTQLHYTAQSLATLRAAVESIRLDLLRGHLVALPMRVAAGAESAPIDPPEAAGRTADLTAGRGMASRNPNQFPHARQDSNLRPAA